MVTQAESELFINHDLFTFYSRVKKKLKYSLKWMLQKQTCMHHGHVQEEKNNICKLHHVFSNNE